MKNETTNVTIERDGKVFELTADEVIRVYNSHKYHLAEQIVTSEVGMRKLMRKEDYDCLKDNHKFIEETTMALLKEADDNKKMEYHIWLSIILNNAITDTIRNYTVLDNIKNGKTYVRFHSTTGNSYYKQNDTQGISSELLEMFSIVGRVYKQESIDLQKDILNWCKTAGVGEFYQCPPDCPLTIHFDIEIVEKTFCLSWEDKEGIPHHFVTSDDNSILGQLDELFGITNTISDIMDWAKNAELFERKKFVSNLIGYKNIEVMVIHNKYFNDNVKFN